MSDTECVHCGSTVSGCFRCGADVSPAPTTTERRWRVTYGGGQLAEWTCGIKYGKMPWDEGVEFQTRTVTEWRDEEETR